MSLCRICGQDKDNTIEVLCRIGEWGGASWHMICPECREKQEWKVAPIGHELVYWPRAGGSSMMQVWESRLHLRPDIAATIVSPGTPQSAPVAPPIHYAPPLHYAPPSQPPSYIPPQSASPQPSPDPQGGVGICQACNVASSKCETCHQKFCSKHLYLCTSTFNPQGDWRCRRHKTQWDNRGKLY